MVQKAIDFATKVHEGQYRKGTDRPYIVHPMDAMNKLYQLQNKLRNRWQA